MNTEMNNQNGQILTNEAKFREQDIRTEVVGLDIGTTKVVAIVGRKNQFGKVEILGYGKAANKGVKSGVVVNLTETIKAINEAVQKAEYNSKIKIKKVVVGIAGQHIRSIQTREYIMRENPEAIIEQAEIDKLVAQVERITVEAGEKIIHALPQEFMVDDEGNIPEIPIGMAGTRLEANFHVVVGKVASIQNLVRCVKMANLEVESVTLEPLASSDAVLLEEEKEGGIALIDIGGGTTDLAIFKNNIIRHTAIIPYGGNVITQDLANGIQVLKRNAEAIKKRFGSAWPAENSELEVVSIQGLPGRPPVEISLKSISRIIKARVEEIMKMADAEIKRYTKSNPNADLLGGVVLTGGGSELKHLPQLVNLITGHYTRVGYPNQHLAAGTESDLKSPIYATAVGLLMKGLDDKKNYEYYEEFDEKQEETKVVEKVEEENQAQETQVETSKIQKKRSKSFLDAIMDFIKKME
jgi:cell division protein FtsA